MTKVEQTGILTEQQFKSSPYGQFMSYEDYVSKALKLGSAFTFQRAITMHKAEETAENSKASVEAWAQKKEIEKAEAEGRYYEALAMYDSMKAAQNTATKRLEYVTSNYGENSSQYNDAFKKYDLSSKSLFSADINLSCARDQFNFANTSAFKAYLTSRLGSA